MVRDHRVHNFKHSYQPLKFVSFCVESCTNPHDFMQAFHPTQTGDFLPIPAVFALFHCLRQLSALPYFSDWDIFLSPYPDSLTGALHPERCTPIFQ